MNEIIYKIRVNRPCRLFIDDEEMMILDENRLTKITLPEGEYLRKVVAIDNKAIFDEAEITLSGSSKLDNITLDTTGLEEAKRNALPRDEFQVGDLMYKALEDDNGVAVAEYVDENITEVVIPDAITFGHYNYEVKEIGFGAFSSYSCLTSITIPNSVTSIGWEAFNGCSSLTSLTIPNSVTSIGDWAFADCKSLTSVSIPTSVTSIGNYAFENCSSLTSITIPNSVTSIGEWAFADCKSLTSIVIPDSVTSIGESAFLGCESMTSVTVPSHTKIADNAFPSHTKIIRE